MTNVKKTLITILVGIVGKIIKNLPEEKAKSFIDDLIDIIEKHIERSPGTIDDALLPLISFMRRVIDVPDDYLGDED